ncbi:MAG TPA: hypothetical protein V6D50_14595 [Chroococcales cyanobacterium]
MVSSKAKQDDLANLADSSRENAVKSTSTDVVSEELIRYPLKLKN